MEMKTCKWCNTSKLIGEFHYRHDTGRYRAECKACYRAAVTARRDPIENRARVKAWQLANPDKRKVQTKRTYEGLRGDIARWAASNLRTSRAYCKKRGLDCTITGADIASLYKNQNGRCALTAR